MCMAYTSMKTSCPPDADGGPVSNRPLALSIRQPWAWAVLYAGKRIENRGWYTSYRGDLYIHAGLRIDYGALVDLDEVIACVDEPRPPAYCGALVGRASLVDCVRAQDVPEGQESWAMGPWCFVLEDIRPLSRPVPLRGSLGLFAVDLRAELSASTSDPLHCKTIPA